MCFKIGKDGCKSNRLRVISSITGQGVKDMPLSTQQAERIRERLKQIIINNSAQSQSIEACITGIEATKAGYNLMCDTCKVKKAASKGLDSIKYELQAMQKHIQAENGMLSHLMEDLKEMIMYGKGLQNG